MNNKKANWIMGIVLLVMAAGLVLYALWPDEPVCRDLYVKNSGYWTKEVFIKYEHPTRGWRWTGPYIFAENEGEYIKDWGLGERIRSYSKTFYIYVGWAPFRIRSYAKPELYVQKEKFEKVNLSTDSNGDYVLDLSSYGTGGPIAFILFLMGAAAVWAAVWYIKYRHTIYTPDLRR